MHRLSLPRPIPLGSGHPLPTPASLVALGQSIANISEQCQVSSYIDDIKFIYRARQNVAPKEFC